MYLRPLAKPTRDGVWYSMQPIGCHKLSGVVAELLSQISISGKITNHSLCASAATHLYQQDIDKQLIMEHTGHRSNAVRSSKRTSNGQMCDISNILYGQSKPHDCQMSPNKCVCTRSVSEVNQDDVQVNVNSGDMKESTETKNDRKISVSINVNFSK